MPAIDVKTGRDGYRIHIGSGIIQQTGRIVKRIAPGASAAVISDTTVARLYGARVMERLLDEGIHARLYTVPDGETSKGLETLSVLYTRLLEDGVRRDSVILALGGGVVGDLAGFAAATILRGIPYVQIPTTVLAQTDSSVGGKVGINHPLGKNCIGSFYPPRAVCIDPDVLTTLDRRDLWAGLGEVAKYGLIHDGAFFTFLETHLDSLARLENRAHTLRIILTCCRIKADIVARDERETGLRRILNFGHTLGHVLEATDRYRTFRHGEAVIHGMHWAAWVSWTRGMLEEGTFRRIEAFLRRFPVPGLPGGLDVGGLLDGVQKDKKQTREGLSLVLLEDIGAVRTECVSDLSREIRGWLAYVA